MAPHPLAPRRRINIARVMSSHVIPTPSLDSHEDLLEPPKVQLSDFRARARRSLQASDYPVLRARMALQKAEFDILGAMLRSKQALAEFDLPEGFGWSSSLGHTGLCFARDASKKNDDANFLPYPLPVPVMDAHTQEIINIQEGYYRDNQSTIRYRNCCPQGTRKDLKPLNVVQPEAGRHSKRNDRVVEWQK
ncbi:uncharacterized protein ATNIH1004_002059 [Aspergillus tanneri]|uniref:Uncharacterized protein n=1 Tax=Aspergillus tanneri TaxID=1220188 RepID=A0A5M9M3E0_9EURO|nr:uncharacterized protein ATNIH1004_002059 [Aspergillus tanneri]KAA8641258.1 hypothetical protein ATNIH1004_002059 [Aspergillus tanneri]